MKTTSLRISALQSIGLLVTISSIVHAQLPFRPIYDAPANAFEEQQLNLLFTQARTASANVAPGLDAGYQRRQISIELNSELENFVAAHTNSAWTPGARLWLARRAQLRCAYSQAAAHFEGAWIAARNINGTAARRIAGEATGGLARAMAQDGRLNELDALEEEARQLGLHPVGTEWASALELRAWARKHPTLAYKCGLYCLDQLGRLTQPGQFQSKVITGSASSVNGFTAAELVQIATGAGLQVHAALLNSLTELPVPSIVHLSSEHFIVVREQRGNFYGVYDRAATGPRWLTAQEVAREASGCVIISDAEPPVGGQTTPLSAAAAEAYRGRMPDNGVYDHDDSDCPGGGGHPDSRVPDYIAAGDDQYAPSSGGCSGCNQVPEPKPEYRVNVIWGMPTWHVSEPFMNLWLRDIPLHYDSAYGPDVSLRLSYNHRHKSSVVSGQYWHGAQFGHGGGIFGLWACSWMSFAELEDDELTVDLLLPQGGWATFAFASAGALASEINYRHNAWLERAGSSGNYTNLILHHSDGSGATYGLRDDRLDGYQVFYRTYLSDPAGNKTTFTYNTSFTNYFGLTNVMAADGTTFTLNLDNSYAAYPYPATVTNVTSSYGASVSFAYAPADGLELTNITDAVGISSQIGYAGPYGGAVRQLTTPYGTTGFTVADDTGLFDRSVRITNALGQQEFYGLIANYTRGDWPTYSASEVPTNTLVGTLDSTERTNRNTFYWNAQQFAAYTTIPTDYFNWTNFNSARIRHWLESDDALVDYTLSVQQQPSPSNWTNIQGQLAWFDYVGKPATNYWRGRQVMPSVIVRVMPDGSTAYQYLEYLTNGRPTKLVEKWANGSTASFRTNTYSYAANNLDRYLHVGPNGEQVSSNRFNAYHQVTTNYDALNQATTYGYDGTTHQLTSRTNAAGLTTINIYDGNHRLQKTIDLEISRTNSYTWYANGNVEGHTSERGLSVTNYWDGLNRLIATKHPDGTTTSNLYIVGSAKILNLTATKDRLGYWTYFGYDALRRKTAETNANGVITRYGYCDCGANSSITNAWSTTVEFVTQFQYDFQGNRVYTYLPDATVTNYFDSLQRHYLTYDAWGGRGFYFDNLNRLTNVSNAYGTEQNTTFDIEDHPIYVADANGVTITNTYDVLGRLSTRTYPDGGVERFGYSARGLVAYTNQLDRITYYGYDEAMRRRSETNANNEIIRYTNNAAGDLLSLTDGKDQTTKWNYDEYGRVTNKLDQTAVEILRYKYDPDSRLTNRWSVAKTNTYYTYDPVGNLTNINYPASTDVRFTYDSLNRVSNMVDAAGTTKYAYASGGQLWTEDGPFSSDTVTNSYNNRLRTALALQQATGFWTNCFGYDAAKRLTNVTSQAGSFGYTLGGVSAASPLLKKLSLPNSSYITNTYDNVARLTGTWLKNSTNGTLNSSTYGYNAGNQRTNLTRTDSSTYDFTYDAIGQLTIVRATNSGGTLIAGETKGYFYDEAWNLNRRTNNTVGSTHTFKVDTKNQLTNASPVGNQTYDGNGNVTYSDQNFFGYAYDDENRLVNWYYYAEGDNGNGSPTSSEDLRTEFVYDGLGRLRNRVEYATDGSTWIVSSETRYTYDGMRVIQECNSGNTPTVSYTRGNDLSGSLERAGGIGGLLARSHGYASTNGNWYTHNFYHADGNGNITYLVNSSQTLAASYRYDPYGNTISSSGTLASANVYRFSSKEIHVNSGLYYYGYRWYSPNLQRWLTRDPIQEAGGINLYSFVRNKPIGRIDKWGLWDDIDDYCEMMRAQAEEDEFKDYIMGDGWSEYEREFWYDLLHPDDIFGIVGVEVGVGPVQGEALVLFGGTHGEPFVGGLVAGGATGISYGYEWTTADGGSDIWLADPGACYGMYCNSDSIGGYMYIPITIFPGVEIFVGIGIGESR